MTVTMIVAFSEINDSSDKKDLFWNIFKLHFCSRQLKEKNHCALKIAQKRKLIIK